ncbi:MAG: sulfatase [Planctomycetota bacterium]
MNRWTYPPLLALALLLALGLTGCGRMAVSEPAVYEPGEPMNVVFFLVDDYGWKDVGYNGSTFYETPNIDKLAATGMAFTDGYAASPVCSPTRAAIMSGKYPGRLNTTDFFGGPQGSAVLKAIEEGRKNRFTGRPLIPADYVPQLPLEEVTIAEALKAEGYATFFAGKWHLGHTGFEPTRQGFDINRGGFRGGGPYEGGKYFAPFPQMPNMQDAKDGEHLPAVLARHTSDFISANKDQRFLAYLSFYSVHTPLMGRPDLVAYYKKKRERLGLVDVFGKEPPRNVRETQAHAVYAAMVHAMDEAVGVVLDTLEKEGIADNTLVIFTADNGGLSTSEGSPTSNLPLRAGKGWLYEGGIREPTIVRWPGLTKPGSKSSVPIISMDFYPTILAAARASARPEERIDGLSLVPALAGGGSIDHEIFDRDAIYWHYPHYGNQGGSPGSAVRMGDWKLIKFYTPGMGLELYNLKDDIGEKNNLAEAEPETTKKLLAMLESHLQETDSRLPTLNPGLK